MFEYKTVWITGASSGIGAELAKQIANKNVFLIISARNERSLREVSKYCEAKGATVEVAPLDLTDEKSIKNVAVTISNRYEKIDFLIHSAGISQRSYAMDTELSVTRLFMETNFFGVVNLTKHVADKMIRDGSGHIIVISSVAGKLGTPMRSSYSASKHALHGYFDSLRAELHKNNIHITVICPGFIQTSITLNSLTGDGSKYNKIDESLKNGVPLEVCAKRIIKGIKRKEDEFIISGYKEKLGVILKRIFPSILFRVVRDVDTINFR